MTLKSFAQLERQADDEPDKATELDRKLLPVVDLLRAKTFTWDEIATWLWIKAEVSHSGEFWKTLSKAKRHSH